MTIKELNDYLVSRAGGGVGAVQNPALAGIASTAIAGAYSHVWGVHRWTVRRGQSTIVTVASTPTTNCPEEFERARWIGCQVTGRKHYVLIRSEEAFDLQRSFPADDSVGVPTECKIVCDQNNTWKVYWWRVPDAVYNMVMSYDRMADVNFFPNLPSHMVKAVQAQALSLMMSGDAKGGALEQLAARALKEAIYADTEVSGVFPIFGKESQWNDWDANGGGSTEVWNALNW